MAIADDVTIDYTIKVVRRSDSPASTVYSVNALYSHLQDEFDELVQMDDQIPMSAQTPTSYTMINGWYITIALTQFLTGGAIQTNGYDSAIMTLQLDGSYTSAVAADRGKQVLDDATPVGPLLDYDNTAQTWWFRSTVVVGDGSTMTIADSGTGAGDANEVSVGTGETIFANPFTLGTLEPTPLLYIYQDGAKFNPDWWDTGQIDILVKVTENGTDIDSKIILVLARTWTDTFDHFQITLTTAGQNAVPLGTADDLNNQNTEAFIEDYTDGTTATVAIDYQFAAPFSFDIGDGAGGQDYECRINADNVSLAFVYEVMKWWTRTGSVTQLETDADATFINGEAYRFVDTAYAEVKASPLGSFAGGTMFGARSVFFINLIAADAQSFQLIDKAGVTRNPPNSQSFVITSMESQDRAAIFLAAGGVPKKHQYTGASGLGAGFARPNLVYGSGFITEEVTPADTPAFGHLIAVAIDESEEHVYRYVSFADNEFFSGRYAFPFATTGTASGQGGSVTVLIDSGKNFTGADTDLQTGDIVYDSTNNEYAYISEIREFELTTTPAKATSWFNAIYHCNVLVQKYDDVDTAYVPYMYEQASSTSITITVTYVADRSVLARVRRKGILPFETVGTYNSTAGYSTAAIRTTDTIVTL